MKCTEHSIQWKLYSIQCTVYRVEFKVCRVQCTVYNVKRTVYNIQYTIYSIHCTVPDTCLCLICNTSLKEFLPRVSHLIYRLHCTARHYTTLHCTALHYIALHGTTLHCTSLHCTTMHWLHCTAADFFCTVLYFTVLHCTALQCSAECVGVSLPGLSCFPNHPWKRCLWFLAHFFLVYPCVFFKYKFISFLIPYINLFLYHAKGV